MNVPKLKMRLGAALAFFFGGTLLSFFCTPLVQAQMLANPVRTAPQGRAYGAGSFVVQEVDYDVNSIVDPTVKRKILVGELGYGVAPTIDLFGQLGFIFDSEIEDLDSADGDGFMFGGGARFVINQDRPLKVVGYGLLNLTRETFDGDGLKCDNDLTDLHGGATASYEVSPTVAPYGGVDIVLHSDGDFKCKGGGNTNIERDDSLSLRIGANFEFSTLYFRPEAIVAGENTIVLNLGTRL